ncbi:MAG: hypothetical protein Q9174_000300 [Haloplaca sp. 1 TL-2023]
MIQPGLSRISRLLQHTPITWRAVHIAGTNGKGSVCAYISAMLRAAGLRTGRFTSPHLIDRWDCITINDSIVEESKFSRAEEAVKTRDLQSGIQASEFELLTATAFEIFHQENINVGVVEVGVGGREDATNIIKNPLVTVITKIGKDHQSLLGDTIEEIARHKAGIIKSGVPCVVDATNSPEVIEVLETIARDVDAGTLIRIPYRRREENAILESFLQGRDLEAHQRTNFSLAYWAAEQAIRQAKPSVQVSSLLPRMNSVTWPGRLQTIDIEGLTGRKGRIILDGAHNAQSAEVLGLFVNQRTRIADQPVTWVIAVSAGKNLQELLINLLHPVDNVVAVAFGPVDGMPWVSPVEPGTVLDEARSLGVLNSLQDAGHDVNNALRQAVRIADGGPLVVCGSLYLVSDVLRLLRQHQNLY